MAFNRAPTVDTYSTARVDVFREITLRDDGASGADEDYLNVFIELVKDNSLEDSRKYILKRGGVEEVIPALNLSTVRGMYFWQDQQKILYCVGRNIYVYEITTQNTIPLYNVFTTTEGYIGFCEYLYDDGSVKILATDGTATSGLISIDITNTVVTCTDTTLPEHQPYLVFLDGYVFVSKKNTATIHCSTLNNPLDWSVLDTIDAEMEADVILRMAKINNYLLVFGSNTIEYFWDAGNESPDTPLQRNDTPIKMNKYLGGMSVYGNKVFYIGTDAGGQPDIFVLQDFKIESIGIPSISRYLSTCSEDFATWTGNIISVQGHTFYIVKAGLNKTFVYDVNTKLWVRWAYQDNSIFNIQHSTVGNSSNATLSLFSLDNTDAIYKFSNTYQDNGVNYTCIITTDEFDFGSLNRKTMKRCGIIADRPHTNNNILLQWSDNDYRTYSTARSINLNQDMPCTYQLGSFRQRSFKLTYTQNTALRIQGLEVDINKGNS